MKPSGIGFPLFGMKFQSKLQRYGWNGTVRYGRSLVRSFPPTPRSVGFLPAQLSWATARANHRAESRMPRAHTSNTER